MILRLIFYCVGVFLVIVKVLNKLTHVRCKSSVCLTGKTAVVTGGNSGIGQQLVKALAARGCKVIILDKDDATETVKAIVKETHNPHIYFKQVNLACLDEVRKVAQDLNKNLKQLHILVNNAGILNPYDGRETLQVNYFSHFLLTHLLAGLLMKSAPSRIIFTSSWAAYLSLLPLDPKDEKLFDNSVAYGFSKQAMTVASKLIALKLENTGVTSNCFHPDVVKSNLWKPIGQGKFDKGIKYYIWLIYAVVMGRTPDEGMQTALHLAVADEVENKSGQFFMECRQFVQPIRVYNQDFCRRFWNFSEEMVDLQDYEKIEHVVKTMQK